MCGIAGWIDFKQELRSQADIIETMAETIKHRGPDEKGRYLAPHIALGHRRLIVVDPEGGGQPMQGCYKGKDHVIVYNGELYNADKIRRELESCGHCFHTRNSDTEVLLHAYMEWGPACLEHINGIFAFAVWNEVEQEIFIARDPLGIKPLFYARVRDSLLFASELKALLAHPYIRAQVDSEGLMEIFIMGPSRTPGMAVFKGIQELKPGHCIIYNRQGLRVKQYWRLVSKPHGEDLETTVVHLREMLKDIVVRQTVADVPVCTLLSGGLDSSAITAFAAGAFQARGEKIQTFSVDYVDNDRFFVPNAFETNADYPWVRRASDFLNTNHQSIMINNQELSYHLKTSMQAHDLPGMTDIDASLYLFCREIRRQFVVGLSGECADEIFGGYPWFQQDMKMADSFPWIRMVQPKMALLAPALVKQLDPEKYIRQRYLEAVAEVPELDGEDDCEKHMRQLFYLNITRFMPTLLERKDRMSMACSLEVRVPFGDRDLVQYVWNLPWKIKNCDGLSKGILRRALKGILPDDLLLRPKNPYPRTHNPAYAETIRIKLSKVLKDPSSPLLSLINVPLLRSYLDSNTNYFSRPWFGQLMGDTQYMAYLLQVNWWLEQYQIDIV
ncbi:MAG TPA: asparagine synthase (glutamine-hydrolyzing) [Syntrophomonas sp.]|jgi:asparagine synthase (glutamine-hydrolysing)|nr:asparagine synthase (glutamine-hydrolyzing) [Syntrophomonas sp.]HCF71727.1 asparagine synthase (glutamine-hydrolyzing) [Syntrophomonas sp.]